MRLIDLEVITPATAAIVTVQEFTDHARLNSITTGAEPDLVQREIDAAIARAEQYLRRSLLEQTLKALFAPDSSLSMLLPRGPVKSVTSITSDGQPITGFTVLWNTITLVAPLSKPAEVLYVSAGFGTVAADVPQPIREGILEYATQLYEDRTGAREPKYAASAGGSTVPRGIHDLWRPYQLEMGG